MRRTRRSRKCGHEPPFLGKLPVASVRAVIHVPLTQLTAGTIVWAHVPYVESEGYKTRPAVVLDRDGRDIELLALTSSLRRFDMPDRYVELSELEPTGLDRPCGIRMTPSVVVDRIDILSIAGHLSERDAEAVGLLV
ncbi:MAG: type II toxin-antitoxin system PemK/MazF family toxin [Acidimicrobiales bacterium]